MAHWKDIKKQLLKDPEVKRLYDELEPEHRLASSLIQARIDQRKTQAQVAREAGISQVMVARLESGTSNPTIGTVSRVARVLGMDLRLVASN